MNNVTNVNELAEHLKKQNLLRIEEKILDAALEYVSHKRIVMQQENKHIGPAQFIDLLARLERRLRRALAQGLEEAEFYSTQPPRTDKRGYHLPVCDNK